MSKKIEERINKKLDTLLEQPAPAAIDLAAPEVPEAPAVPEVPDAPDKDALGGADVSGVSAEGEGPTIIAREDLKSELDEIDRLTLQKEQKCRMLAMQLPDGSEIQSAMKAMAESEIEQWKALNKFTNGGIA